MNIITESVRPDTLTSGDFVFNPLSAKWEPVRDTYWSEDTQRYVVWMGPLGHVMHTYGASEKVNRQRYYK
jgi:hypothetical protein